MDKKHVWVILLVVAVALGFFAASNYWAKEKAARAAGIQGPKLDAIRARKPDPVLKVGIRNEHKPGIIEHITTNTTKEYWGLEPEFAKAIAAAIGLDPEKDIKFVEVSLDGRFANLMLEEGVEGQTDVTIRTVTLTSKRDTTRDNIGFEFGPIYFYDGTNVLVNDEPVVGTFNVIGTDGSSNLADIQKLQAEGTNWPGNWDIVIGYSTTPESGDAGKNTEKAFKDGTYTVPSWAPDGGTTYTINGFTSDTALLSAFKVANLPASAPWYLYFPTPIVKSPLAAVVAEGDPNWTEVVRWVFYVLMAAEEQGFVKNGPMPSTWKEPTVPGLASDWSVNVIRAVGNYKEIWDRTLGKYGDAFLVPSYASQIPLNASPHAKKKWREQYVGLTRGLNELYINGGLHYPPPIVPDTL